jgi:hypothetical protein
MIDVVLKILKAIFGGNSFTKRDVKINNKIKGSNNSITYGNINSDSKNEK